MIRKEVILFTQSSGTIILNYIFVTDRETSDLMAGSLDGSYDQGSQSDESSQFERYHIEPFYDAFICPLSKQIMRDPVTLETGITYEREAIENWFKDCKENGRKLVCPITLKELRSTDLNPSIALRSTIEEWNARNEAAQLDMARRSLFVGNAETEILQALKFIQHLCQNNPSTRHVIRNAELIPMIVDVLKSSSRRVRCKALEILRIVVEEDDDNKVVKSLLFSSQCSVLYECYWLNQLIQVVWLFFAGNFG